MDIFNPHALKIEDVRKLWGNFPKKDVGNCPTCGEKVRYGAVSYSTGNGCFARHQSAGEGIEFYCPNGCKESHTTVWLRTVRGSCQL
jgi:hypothetical protein